MARNMDGYKHLLITNQYTPHAVLLTNSDLRTMCIVTRMYTSGTVLYMKIIRKKANKEFQFMQAKQIDQDNSSITKAG